jgi:membrane-bound lytic murein transglycosylase D
VGAGGLWQFMDATARIYGMRVDFWVDDRFDPEASTFGAAAYLKDLRTRFGSWELALAAYNAGYGLVMTAVDRHNTNNFWALTEIESGLPHDTTNYVPKIFAAAVVAANRDAFGVDAATVRSLPAAEWVDLEVGGATALAEMAKLLEVDPELLGELNARYIRGRTPPGTKSKVHVPREASARWPAVARILSPGWSDERIHVMREGERLAAVATRHGTTEKQLRSLNGIADTAELRAGVPLLVPRSGGAGGEAAATDLPLAAVPPVHPGPGQRLVFLEATRATTATSLARAFAIPWEHLVLWNDLDPSARLQDGQVLQVIVPETFDADAAGVKILEPPAVEHVVRGSREHLEASLRRRGLVRRGYEVKTGDTLERISRHLDLSVGDLARINGVDRAHTPKGGDLLVVYVPEGRTRGTTDAPDPAPVYAAPDPPSSPGVPAGASPGTSPEETPPSVEDAKPRRRRGRRGGSRTPSSAGSSRVPGQEADPQTPPPPMR